MTIAERSTPRKHSLTDRHFGGTWSHVLCALCHYAWPPPFPTSILLLQAPQVQAFSDCINSIRLPLDADSNLKSTIETIVDMADQFAQEERPIFWTRALFWSVACGSLSCAEKALAHGASPRWQNPFIHRKTVFHIAAMHQHSPALLRLVMDALEVLYICVLYSALCIGVGVFLCVPFVYVCVCVFGLGLPSNWLDHVHQHHIAAQPAPR